MIESAEHFVQLRTSTDPADYRRAATDRAPTAVWLDVLTRYPHMRTWVVLNRTVPDSVLGLLADDADPRVRAMVATRRRMAVKVYERLAADRSDDVRHRIAGNTATPRHVLLSLLDDDVDRVRHAAKRRLEAYDWDYPLAA